MTIDDRESLEARLARFDDEWRRGLASVSLATELRVALEAANEAATILGSLYTYYPNRAKRLMRDHPAVVAIVLPTLAADVYRGGEFWPNFWHRCGVVPSQLDAPVWGDAFLNSLRVLGLPRFDHLPKRYLGPILAHAGVPDYCLQDYFVALEMGIRRVGVSSNAIVDWVMAHSDTSLANIDVPVRRFLEFGGDYAVDFVDRSLDVLARLTANQDTSPSMLPERVVEAARSHLTTRGPVPGRGHVQGGLRRTGRAAIRIEPFQMRIWLSLPRIDDLDEAFAWNLVADGDHHQVVPRKALGGRTIGVEEAAWTIPRPTRSITVAISGIEGSQELELVNTADPLVVFNDEGELLPARLPVPAGEIWALFATDPSAGPVAFEQRITYEEQPPLGWSGWRLARVNLTNSSTFRLSEAHPSHEVRTDTRARLTPTGVEPTLTVGGKPVHTSRPLIHLPDNITSDWSLVVVDTDSGDQVLDRILPSFAETHDTADPFEGLSSPLVGRFEITVRGPLGRGVSQTIAIAEGLVLDPKRPFRALTPSGLEPIEIRCSGVAIDADPPLVAFNPSETKHRVVLAGDGRVLEATLEPSSMAVASVVGGATSKWQFGLLRVDVDALSDTTLYVRGPGALLVLTIRAVDDAGAIIQLLRPQEVQARSDNEAATRLHTFALAQLGDTADTLRSFDLVADIAGESVRVVRVEPKSVATGALLVDGEIELEQFGGGSVSVRVWSVYEPWLGHVDVDVPPGGRFPIPTSFLRRGSLCLQWRRVDPWRPADFPTFPESGEYHLLHAPLDLDGSSPWALALSGRNVDSPPLHPAEAWSLLAMRVGLTHDVLSTHVVDQLTKRLRNEPTGALQSLAAMYLPPDLQILLIVESGLGWAVFAQPAGIPDDALDATLDSTIRSSLIAGALTAIPILTSARSRERFPASWAAMGHAFGDSFGVILSGACDPHQRSGGFDAAPVLDKMPDDRFREIVHNLKVVPRAPLDADTRMASALRLFELRRDPRLTEAARNSERISRDAAVLLASTGRDAAARAIKARSPLVFGEPWAHLSALSLSLAVLARFAARGDGDAQVLIGGASKHWRALARCAPQLVAIDLVLAELHAAVDGASELPPLPAADQDDREQE